MKIKDKNQLLSTLCLRGHGGAGRVAAGADGGVHAAGGGAV